MTRIIPLAPGCLQQSRARPSAAALKRAEATKQYLETLYAMRKSRDKAKQERRDSLEKQLKLEKKSHVEIEERLKELDVRIHFISPCIPPSICASTHTEFHKAVPLRTDRTSRSRTMPTTGGRDNVR